MRLATAAVAVIVDGAAAYRCGGIAAAALVVCLAASTLYANARYAASFRRAEDGSLAEHAFVVFVGAAFFATVHVSASVVYTSVRVARLLYGCAQLVDRERLAARLGAARPPASHSEPIGAFRRRTLVVDPRAWWSTDAFWRRTPASKWLAEGAPIGTRIAQRVCDDAEIVFRAAANDRSHATIGVRLLDDGGGGDDGGSSISSSDDSGDYRTAVTADASETVRNVVGTASSGVLRTMPKHGMAAALFVQLVDGDSPPATVDSENATNSYVDEPRAFMYRRAFPGAPHVLTELTGAHGAVDWHYDFCFGTRAAPYGAAVMGLWRTGDGGGGAATARLVVYTSATETRGGRARAGYGHLHTLALPAADRVTDRRRNCDAGLRAAAATTTRGSDAHHVALAPNSEMLLGDAGANHWRFEAALTAQRAPVNAVTTCAFQIGRLFIVWAAGARLVVLTPIDTPPPSPLSPSPHATGFAFRCAYHEFQTPAIEVAHAARPFRMGVGVPAPASHHGAGVWCEPVPGREVVEQLVYVQTEADDSDGGESVQERRAPSGRWWLCAAVEERDAVAVHELVEIRPNVLRRRDQGGAAAAGDMARTYTPLVDRRRRKYETRGFYLGDRRRIAPLVRRAAYGPPSVATNGAEQVCDIVAAYCVRSG